MRNKIIIIFLLIASFIGLLYLKKHKHVIKDAVIDFVASQEAESVTYAGAFSSRNRIYERLEVHGATDLKNVTINKELIVYGAVTLEGVSVDGKAIFYGAVSATNSSFNDIELAGKIIFNSSTARTIEVLASQHKETQTVELFSSRVMGDIVFFDQEQPGKVIIYKGSKVKGTITNAQVVYE